MRNLLIAACLVLPAASAPAAGRKIDPTFLKRPLPSVTPATVDFTARGCEYRPLFGAGDQETTVVRGVARFGELRVNSGASCREVNYPREEHVLVVLDGAGTLRTEAGKTALRRNDFLYVAPGTKYTLAAEAPAPLRVLAMGFFVRASAAAGGSVVRTANIDDVPLQTVGGHPDSVRYRLLLGDRNSQRDRIAAAETVTSLYIMEFAPGGTNFPHHHDSEEEIYLLLDGTGDMVAGSGTDGIAARFPARPGDAYFFRLNCTAGFYNSAGATARILAVRSLYPRSR